MAPGWLRLEAWDTCAVRVPLVATSRQGRGWQVALSAASQPARCVRLARDCGPSIPHSKHCLLPHCRSYPPPWTDKPYLLHLGLQCYDRAFLSKYCKMPATPLMVGAS